MAGFALLQAVIAFFQFPGTGRRLRHGADACVHPVVPEHGRGQGGVRHRGAADPRTGSRPDTPSAAPLAAAAVAAEPVAAPPPVAPVAAVAAVARNVGTRARAGRGLGQAAPHHMRITDVEGIGPADAEKLAAIGITTTDQLLAAGAKPSDRDRIASPPASATSS